METPTYADWQARAVAFSPLAGLIIDGAVVPAASGQTFTTLNPATGSALAEVPAAGEEDVDRAVAAARRTFDSGLWSRAAPADRKAVLLRLADLIREHLDELALTDSLDGGKLIADTYGIDIPGSAAILQWYAELIDKTYGEVAPTALGDLATITREPVGVVGAVVPWNFPLEMAMWKVAPALAAGNSVVLKPAEQSPLSAIRFGQLALEAGLPPGVLNVVPGLGPVAGQALGRHPDVDALAFTGSTATGARFLEYSAQSNLKRIALECGGKSANLIFADADDLDAAAALTVDMMFACAGQVCSANSRLLVQESVASDFVAAVVKRTQALQPGDPLDPASGMGPLVSALQLERVLEFVEAGQEHGTLAVGGGRAQVAAGSGESEGYFVQPTVFTHVDADSALAREEVFGPVLSVMTFGTEDEGVAMANDSKYGLAASVWTGSLARAMRVSKVLRAGTVSVNTIDALDVVTPFGGYKQSGFGRDLSAHALDNYTNLKTTWFAY